MAVLVSTMSVCFLHGKSNGFISLKSCTKSGLVLPGLALAAAYVLEENAARAARGRSPVDLDVGASPRGALHHCMRTVGHELGFLLIDDLHGTHSRTGQRRARHPELRLPP